MSKINFDDVNSIVMPESIHELYIQFFYDGSNRPVIRGGYGSFTTEILSDISNDFLFYNEESFSKGAGDYLFKASYSSTLYGGYDVIELDERWELDEVKFEPLN